ncbi:MAG: arylsulfatase [Burkholderiaceae bacterium]|nr:arylsulfatase [Burkholderiaceae bacterium]
MQKPFIFKEAGALFSLGVLAAGGIHGAANAGTVSSSQGGNESPGKRDVRAATAGKAGVKKASAEPNVLIILLDDAGFAQSDTVGGEIHTPTFSRIADSGIRYNAFHTTAISSATRASLLTGRNHHHVGNGTITELASADDPGYNGIIPDSTATVPEVLHTQGYSTVAFGKWHNTPTHEVTPTGPFTHWPTGYGFDHFYGFNGGETDQYHPSLYNDTTPVEPPNDPQYHLSGDLANKAVAWLEQHEKAEPNKPFFMYWAPGGVHAPHQVFKEWADKYKGKFDSGWDAYRARAFARQKAIGWIPQDTVNTPRPQDMAAWDSLTPEEKKFQAREMEVYAGFLEYTDTQAGKVVDELEKLGLRDNTLIFYVFSDNGASSEGMNGAINDLLVTNGVPTTLQQHMQALNQTYGGLDALGGPKLEEHYNAAWAWAGESPFVGTKLVAGYFGGTRTPLAISWPKRIAPDKTIRTQFHHVNDIAPTIYDVLGIAPPAVVNGVQQDRMDGISMTYTFADPKAANRKPQQYFEIMGSRAEYVDGWIASVFGPRKPWVADQSFLLSLPAKLSVVTGWRWFGDTFGWMKWKPENDQWALFDLHKDYSQANDLAATNPAKLAELKRKFEQDAEANHVNPIGASFKVLIDSAMGPKQGLQSDWHFNAGSPRLPEWAAPNLRSRSSLVTVDADVPANANGVLYSVGDVGAGVSLYVMNGVLTYEYNGFSLTHTKIRAPLPAGHDVIEVKFDKESSKRAGPADVTLRINGQDVAHGEVPVTAPIGFTATGTFNVGLNRGSPVSLDYFDRAPFAFNGEIRDVHIQYQ